MPVKNDWNVGVDDERVLNCGCVVCSYCGAPRFEAAQCANCWRCGVYDGCLSPEYVQEVLELRRQRLAEREGR